jgi:hypothetical protein
MYSSKHDWVPLSLDTRLIDRSWQSWIFRMYDASNFPFLGSVINNKKGSPMYALLKSWFKYIHVLLVSASYTKYKLLRIGWKYAMCIFRKSMISKWSMSILMHILIIYWFIQYLMKNSTNNYWNVDLIRL